MTSSPRLGIEPATLTLHRDDLVLHHFDTICRIQCRPHIHVPKTGPGALPRDPQQKKLSHKSFNVTFYTRFSAAITVCAVTLSKWSKKKAKCKNGPEGLRKCPTTPRNSTLKRRCESQQVANRLGSLAPTTTPRCVIRSKLNL